MEHTFAVFLLSLLPGVGERTLARVLEFTARSGEPLAEILQRPTTGLRAELQLPERALAALYNESRSGFRRARALAARLAGDGVRMATVADADYPRRLRLTLPSPPVLVFLYGSSAIFAPPTVALLSSREITAHLVNATVLATRCAIAEGLSVVVGGMKSTYRIAASTVRAARARRIVVLDRGVLAAFAGNLRRDPFGLGPARLPFDPSFTLALSRFRPHDHAAPANGRKRDEMVAALGDLLFVASARPGGEIERLCMAAIDRGGCVLLWQGENRSLLAAGAYPVDEHEIHQGFKRFLVPSP